MKSPTLSDVAKKAEVSPSTVSKILSNTINASEETKKRVFEAIRELNYMPNENARKLKLMDLTKDKGKKTFNIGCISFCTFKFSDPYYSKILDGIDQEILNQKYNMLYIYTVNQLISRPELILNMINTNQVDGLICIGYYVTEDTRLIQEEIEKKSLPIVIVNASFKNSFDCIDADAFQAGYDAVKYLSGLGHRRIGYVGDTNIQEELRFQGYNKALKDLNLEYDGSIIAGNSSTRTYNKEAGYEYMTRILKKTSKLPTAVFVMCDLAAIGVIEAIRAKGLKVPDDISVISYDDIDIAQHFIPNLTTFRVRKEELGIVAVRKLIERINNPEMQSSMTTLPTELIIRQTCKDIKGK